MKNLSESAFSSPVTREMEEEMNTRLRENPDFARRIGNFGFLELEESWGDEATIINTARISTTNQRINSMQEFGDRERKLLYYLLSQNHGTPFETVYFRWRIVAPIFVIRQWIRHRISSFNEFSQRYREPIPAYYIPDAQACTVGNMRILSEEQLARYCQLMEELHAFYQEGYREICQRVDEAEARGSIPKVEGGRNPYRARGRELLRNAMPVSCYTDLYWTINFRSLMNFFDLRRKSNAQYEIRQFADVAYSMFKSRFPILGETMDQVLKEKGGIL
ncbi:MAG: FAD-dependent thymidylate synthase [Magnetococcales bacterium]|nr:FAD-dependent thymidylate synthase [Magnetococcales bacterium]NGZ27034.1 FAD-dependent thymidylate synthase [Magnetococcales bacterium]